MKTNINKVAMFAALLAFSGIAGAGWPYNCLMNTGTPARPNNDIRDLLSHTCANYSAINGGETCLYCQSL